jgi:hypothetical protein
MSRSGYWLGEPNEHLACRTFANVVDEMAAAYERNFGRRPRSLLVVGRWHPAFKQLRLSVPDVTFAADEVSEALILREPLSQVLAEQIVGADIVLLNGFLEARSDPVTALAGLGEQLGPEALLAVTFASTRSVASRVLRKRWREFFANTLAFYDAENLNLLMARVGLGRIAIWRMRTFYSVGYAASRLGASPSAQRFLSIVGADALHFAPPAGYQAAMFRPVNEEGADRLSIIVPVYNEAASVGAILSSLTSLELPVEYEVIAVESASSDGSREVVESFAQRGEIRAIFQPEARGKGLAVRQGIEAANGSIILIQDADFEYDLDDYNALLAPILQRHASFVLGSRTLGLDDWRIRHYAGTPLRGALVDLAQLIFERTFNVLYRQKTTDINTMFKVFRRECIDGCEFTSERFNFDIELVCKIVRNGHVPLEVPVNYQGRGFDEGKKVTLAEAWPNYFEMFRVRFAPSRRSRPAG